jgi:(1->4)-alpha-D-glucan 1-alpha-D-glucosylmutase
VVELHAKNAARAARGDLSLSTTTTHDTKRSEDVQARIHVLSELADDWSERALRWSRLNEPHARRVHGHRVPDPSEELLLYQTLLGAWPLEAGASGPAFRERLERYLVKAAREAKVWTSWLSPDEEHERALLDFTRAILEPSRANRFLAELHAFLPRVALHGALNGLAQLVLKLGSPGPADFYQGSELWDQRLVDPDNRGPVDFDARERRLAELERRAAADRRGLLRELGASWRDGRIKLFVTWQGLRCRRERRALFLAGDYLPLQARGEWADHVVGFARRRGREWALVLVPRLLARRLELVRFPRGGRIWRGCEIALPAGAPLTWENVFTGETVEAERRGRRGVVRLASVWGRLPVAVLVS